MKEIWNSLAKGYSVKKGYGRGSLIHEKKMLVEFIGSRKAKLVLDIGCGPGRHIRSLKSMGINTMGLDFSTEMLKEARKLGKDDYILGDAQELPIASNSIDCCICMGNSIGSLENANKAIMEMLRVSKAALIEFRHESGKTGWLKRRFDDCYYKIRVWDTKEVGKMLKELHEYGIISSYKIVMGQKLGRGYFFYAVVEK